MASKKLQPTMLATKQKKNAFLQSLLSKLAKPPAVKAKASLLGKFKNINKK